MAGGNPAKDSAVIAIAIQVPLVVADIALVAADVAQLAIERFLIVPQIARDSFGGKVVTITPRLVELVLVARDVGAQLIDPRVIALNVPIVAAQVTPIVSPGDAGK